MQSIEVEGKTTKDAIKTALAKLKVPRSRVRIKVLAEEQKGLFGMKGPRQARIRVTIKQVV